MTINTFAHRITHTLRCCLALWLALQAVLPLQATRAIGIGQSQANWSPAEQWIIDQARVSQIADLSTKFTANKDRVLSNRFLTAFLTGNLVQAKDVPGGAVQISGAIINDVLDLSGQHIELQPVFEDVHFNSDVSLLSATTNGSMAFLNCIFEGDFDLAASHINGQLNLSGSQFEDRLRLYQATLNDSLNLKDTRFDGRANLSGLIVQNDILATHAHFAVSTDTVQMDGMNVTGAIWLTDATVDGGLDLSRTRAANLHVSNSRFTSDRLGANFNDAQVSTIVSMSNTLFSGPVDLRGMTVGLQLKAQGVQFASTHSTPQLNKLHVADTAFLDQAVFKAGANFADASFGGELRLNEASFSAATQTADFRGISVAKSIDLTSAHLVGPAEFNNASIGVAAIFNKTTVTGPISFADATLTDLLIDAAPQPISELDISRAHIKRQIALRGSTVKMLIATSLKSDDNLLIENVTLPPGAIVDLRLARLTVLQLHGLSWPADEKPFLLGDVQYQLLNDDASNERHMLDILDSSRFDSKVYVGLEQYYVQKGENGLGERVFFALRQRELNEGNLSLIDRVWRVFLNVFIGYGRHPERALLWGSLIVLIGMVVFRRKSDMQLRDGSIPETESYNAFWYSLNLFLPVVELNFGKQWEPKPQYRLTRLWARIQTLLGWLLLPIGLAAVSGLIH